MQNELTFVRRGVLCVLDLAVGTRVHVVAGRVWLTEADNTEDFVMSVNDEHVVKSAGRVLVDVVDVNQEACIRVLAPSVLKEAA